MGQQGFWDVEQRYKKPEQKQDLLVRRQRLTVIYFLEKM